MLCLIIFAYILWCYIFIRFMFVFIKYILMIVRTYAPIHQNVVNVVALDLSFNLIMLAHDWAPVSIWWAMMSQGTCTEVFCAVLPFLLCTWLATKQYWGFRWSNNASTVNSVVVSHVSKTATGAYWWQQKMIEDVVLWCYSTAETVSLPWVHCSLGFHNTGWSSTQ